MSPFTHDSLEQICEYRMKNNSFHFASMLESSTGTLGLRGRPDRFDPDAFGSTLQRNVFIAGPGVDAVGGQIIDVAPSEEGIEVHAEGTVASEQGVAGTFSWTDFYSYDFEQQEIRGEGVTYVHLAQTLTGEMNVSRAASNFLYNHPLNTGEFGNTGDMRSVTFDYGPDSPVRQLTWTPAPGMEGFFPTDNSTSVTATLHGEVNRSDPNRFAIRKPTLQHATISHEPNTKLTQGGFWDSQAVGFQYDNVGVSQIVRPQNTSATDFEFSTITVWTPPDTATMSVADAAITEPDTTNASLSFPVSLDRAVDGGFNVAWALTNNSEDRAEPDVDFVMDSGTIHFDGTAGEVQEISVSIIGDVLPEPDETFTLVLNSVSTADVRFTDNEAEGLIIDNDEVPDSTPCLRVGDATKVERDGGYSFFYFRVTLVGSNTQGVSVNYTTADGTARTSNGDYRARTDRTLEWSPGDTRPKYIPVVFYGDTSRESNENFYVNLSGVSGAELTRNRGIGTIVNDDGGGTLPCLSIGDTAKVERDGGHSFFYFRVTLVGSNSQGVRVNYTTADGTAETSNRDYRARTDRTLRWSPGDTRPKYIPVVVYGDPNPESNENFYVNLSGASRAELTKNRATGTIVNDDSSSYLPETAQTLLAAGEKSSSANDSAPLTQADLQPIVDAARDRWLDLAVGAMLEEKLQQVDVVIADLEGPRLGSALSDVIYIDRNAAGHGWYIDARPTKDEEFTATRLPEELRATTAAAVDRIDLLTVVAHELGHVAGLDDFDAAAHSIMSRELDTGVRRIVGQSEADAAFASG